MPGEEQQIDKTRTEMPETAKKFAESIGKNIEALTKSGSMTDKIGHVVNLIVSVTQFFRALKEGRLKQGETVRPTPESIPDVQSARKTAEAEVKTMQTEQADLQKNLPVLQQRLDGMQADDPQRPALEKQINESQARIMEISLAIAGLLPQLKQLSMEQAAREGEVKGLQNRLTDASPARSVALVGGRLTIEFRDNFTDAQRKELDEIRQSSGGILDSAASGNPLSLAVPGQFWSTGNPGARVRNALFDFLAGPPQPAIKQAAETKIGEEALKTKIAVDQKIQNEQKIKGSDEISIKEGASKEGEVKQQQLKKGTEAAENLPEVTARQFERQQLMALVNALPSPPLRIDTTNVTNGIIINRIIQALSIEAASGPYHEFSARMGVICLPSNDSLVRYPRTQPDTVIAPNWPTLMRSNPLIGIGVIAEASNNANMVGLRGSLTKGANAVRVAPVSGQEEMARRMNDIVFSDLYMRLSGRLDARIVANEGNLKTTGMSTTERVAEGFVTTTLFGGPTLALETASLLGYNPSWDIRPSAVQRQIKMKEAAALKTNVALRDEFRSHFAGNMPNTPAEYRRAVEYMESTWKRLADVNYQEFNQRLGAAITVLDYTERGLNLADAAAAQFAQRVPFFGPLLYSSLRNGVGMLAGEQVRDSNGQLRPMDWTDVGINVASDIIPLGRLANYVPGARPGMRFGIRYLIRNAGRYAVRAALDEAKAQIKDQLIHIADMMREGKTWGEIYDEVMSQEPQYGELLLNWGARMIGNIAGDTATAQLRNTLASGARNIPRNWRPTAIEWGKMGIDRLQKQAVAYTQSFIKEAADQETAP